MDKILMRRYLPVILLLVGFGMIMSTRSQSAMQLAAPLNMILPQYEGLAVRDNVIGAEERRVAGMSDYVARTYLRPDSLKAFEVYVGYYERQTQGKTIHSPRNCLPGAGWEILKAETGTIRAAGAAHVVNEYLLKNGAAQALVFYWYQGRGRVVANEYAVKWNLLRDAALKGHTEEALVRIVVPVRVARGGTPAEVDQAIAAARQLGTDVGNKLLVDVRRSLPSDEAANLTGVIAGPVAAQVALTR